MATIREESDRTESHDQSLFSYFNSIDHNDIENAI